jgi:hypothetical protein
VYRSHQLDIVLVAELKERFAVSRTAIFAQFVDNVFGHGFVEILVELTKLLQPRVHFPVMRENVLVINT